MEKNRKNFDGNGRYLRSSLAIAAFLLLRSGEAGAAQVAVKGVDAGLPAANVRILAAGDGKVYVGAGRNGVASYETAGDRVTDLSAGAPLARKDVSSIAVFQGKLYVGTSMDLLVFDGRSWERMEKEGNVTLRNVMLSASPDGKELWAAAMTLAGGTIRYDGSKWTFMGGEGRGLFNDISCFAFGRNGTWMGSATGTVYLHKGEDVQFFRDGLSGIVLALAVAGDSVYAGTDAGLFRLEGSVWKPVSFPPEWGTTRVTSMAPGGTTLYLATTAGLVRIKGGAPERLSEGDGMPAGPVHAVAFGGGVVYAGTPAGLAVVRGW